MLGRRAAAAAAGGAGGQPAKRFLSTPSAPAQRRAHEVGSSTIANDFKLAHPRQRPPPLPVIDPPKWSAEQAVHSIIYNSASPLIEYAHTGLVRNARGADSRITSSPFLS